MKYTKKMPMVIRNPREQHYPQLQSFVTSEFVEPSTPRMRQVHGNRVVVVTSQDQEIGEADGMVTTLMNVRLETRVADCGNIYAYDPVEKVIGVCHSGWQGTHLNIIHNMISEMIHLGSTPKNILIWTGPCISGKNYQFGPEVKELFGSEYYERKEGTYYLDLPSLHRDQLIAGGILAEHIIQSEICTFGNFDLPSYRRDGADRGRLTGTIMQMK